MVFLCLFILSSIETGDDDGKSKNKIFMKKIKHYDDDDDGDGEAA